MTAPPVDPDGLYAGPFPELRTPRLLLRDLRPEDADALFALFGDPEVTRYYDLETFTDRAQAVDLVRRWRARWQGHIGLRWALCRGDDADALLGTCGYNLWWPQAARALLGFDLRRSSWGQGLMREALTAVLDFGYAVMDLNRVEALVFDGNQASTRLLQRLGFVHEGVLRQYQPLHGTPADMHLFSLLRREYAIS